MKNNEHDENDGDEQFLTLFVTNQNRIYRFVLSLIPRREDAEDLFQQTCLTLWRNRAKYNPAVGNFTSWACAIAHNHVRNFRRQEAARPNLLSDDVVESLAATRATHQSLLNDWHRALDDCLEKLTPHQRSLVERCYGGSESIKDAAEADGRTPNAVYKVLRHIRGVLHDCVQRVDPLDLQGGVS